MSDVFVGVDVGANGGMACIRPERTWLYSFAKGTPQEATRWLVDQCVDRCLAWDDKPTVLVEKVGATPQMGTTSAFSFGRSFGLVEGILTGAGIAFDYVTPAKWQGALGLREKGRRARASGETRGSTDSQKKRRHREMAQRLYPDPSILIGPDGKPGARITNAVADALLMAEYAKRRAVSVA